MVVSQIYLTVLIQEWVLRIVITLMMLEWSVSVSRCLSYASHLNNENCFRFIGPWYCHNTVVTVFQLANLQHFMNIPVIRPFLWIIKVIIKPQVINREKPIAGNQIQDIWLWPLVVCHWAIITTAMFLNFMFPSYTNYKVDNYVVAIHTDQWWFYLSEQADYERPSPF